MTLNEFETLHSLNLTNFKKYKILLLYKKKKCYLCSSCSKLFEPKLIDNMSAREFLQRNYNNEVKLRQFAELIWPFSKKMFFYKRDSLEFFN